MVTSARKRLVDAQNEDLDPDSQFDLAYGATPGWRSRRFAAKAIVSKIAITVFQTPLHTLGTERSRV